MSHLKTLGLVTSAKPIFPYEGALTDSRDEVWIFQGLLRLITMCLPWSHLTTIAKTVCLSYTCVSICHVCQRGTFTKKKSESSKDNMSLGHWSLRSTLWNNPGPGRTVHSMSARSLPHFLSEERLPPSEQCWWNTLKTKRSSVTHKWNSGKHYKHRS